MTDLWRWLRSAECAYHWRIGVMFVAGFPAPYFSFRLQANEAGKWVLIGLMAAFAAYLWVVSWVLA